MADGCAGAGPIEKAELRRVLWRVLWLNAAMFVAELVVGLIAGSTSVLADGGDMLADALVYAMTLLVIGRGARATARVALMKGLLMSGVAASILIEALLKSRSGVVPHTGWMVGVSLAALAANGIVYLSLLRHRNDDLNLRAAWLCSRNDVIANVAVLGAAGGVAWTARAWPDVLVGVALTVLFGWSAVTVVRAASRELRHLRTADG